MPVVAMPCVTWRWKTRKTVIGGRKPRTEEAITSAYWMLPLLTREARPTGTVCDFVRSRTGSGHRKAFQELMKVRSRPWRQPGG